MCIFATFPFCEALNLWQADLYFYGAWETTMVDIVLVEILGKFVTFGVHDFLLQLPFLRHWPFGFLGKGHRAVVHSPTI
jgi:hypothetical protein